MYFLQVSFDSLPDELIILIFLHVSPEDLACHVSKVCLRWQSIAKDPSLWECAVLKYNKFHSKAFAKTIQFAPLLAKLEINMFQISDETVQSILSGCEFVRYLSLYPGPLTPVHLTLKILKFYQPELKGLNMYIDDEYYNLIRTSEGLSGVLGHMKKLDELTLRGPVSSHLLKENPFQFGLPSLQILDMSGLYNSHLADSDNVAISDTWPHILLGIVKYKASRLKKLLLPTKVFNYEMTSVIEDSFVSSTIEYLKGCEYCLWAVKRLQNLKILHICGLTPKSLSNLREKCWLPASSYSLVYDWINDAVEFLNVRELTLENIVDDEREIVYRLLSACKNLESLTLFASCPSPSQLADVILQMPPLKILNMHRMPCLRSRHLELIVSHQPNLMLLNLMGNSLTDGILQYYRDVVQSRMPNLQLKCDWGYWSKNGGQQWQPHACSSSVNETKVHSNVPEILPYKLSIDSRNKIMEMLDAVSDYEDDD